MKQSANNRANRTKLLRLLQAEKFRFGKIGFYAIVQRTMPETARIIFRFLMRLRLSVFWLVSKLPFGSSRSPTAQTTMLEQGCAYLHQGHIAEAAAEFSALLKKAPLNKEAAIWLIRTLLIQGDYLAAQKILFQALAWHSDSIPLRRLLAGILHATGSYWEAESEYKKLLKFQHESIDVFLGLAELAIADARYDDALQRYKRVLQIDSRNIAASLGVIECERSLSNEQALVSTIINREKKITGASSEGAAVLIIDSYLPSPGVSAGSLRLFEIIKLIRNAGYDVTLIARNGEYQKRSRLLLETLGVETYATDPERLVAWSYRSSAPVIDFTRLLKKHRYVLAILSRYNIAGVYMDVLRKHAPNLPIVIDSVDVQYIREEKKQLLYGTNSQAASEVRAEELQVYNQADSLIAVSDRDAQVLINHFPEKTIFTIPLIYQTKRSSISFENRKDLLFVGNFVHPPNSDALVHYTGRILPLLKTKIPEIKTYVAGANSIPLLESFASKDLILTGYVPELRSFLDSCKINVVPLRYGAGMNGKILESMACGLPVITSPVGAQGISDDGSMIVAEDPEDFVDDIVRLYNDERLWNSIRDRAYTLIETKFTPQVVTQKIADLLHWASKQ